MWVPARQSGCIWFYLTKDAGVQHIVQPRCWGSCALCSARWHEGIHILRGNSLAWV